MGAMWINTMLERKLGGVTYITSVLLLQTLF